MSASETPLNLDDPVARRQLWQAYQLLLQLVDGQAADSKDPVKEPQLSTAPDDAQEAPSPRGA